MLPGDKCNGVSELAEGHTYIRGRCKQLGELYHQVCQEDQDYILNSEYEGVICKENICHRAENLDQRSENICRRISMSV